MTRLTKVRVFCTGCGFGRDVTRRVRDKRCAGCKKEDARKERQSRYADMLMIRLEQKDTPVLKRLVLRVLEEQYLIRRGVIADKQRARAGK